MIIVLCVQLVTKKRLIGVGPKTDEGVPPEESVCQNRPKKEETFVIGAGAVKHESKEGIKHGRSKQPVGFSVLLVEASR